MLTEQQLREVLLAAWEYGYNAASGNSSVPFPPDEYDIEQRNDQLDELISGL